MNRAFTLIELLVVVGIMGLLGTISVGGYRAMQRGMEERGVLENAGSIVKVAYERAQIDRQPAMLFFWNETIRSQSDEDNEIVVGHAVAVRRSGRLSGLDGDYLLDEFADLEQAFPPPDDAQGSASSGSSSKGATASNDKVNTMKLYCLDNLTAGSSRQFSIVSSQVERRKFTGEIYPHGKPQNDGVGDGDLEMYGFRLVNKNGVSWKTGSAYGFEFAEITLPKNYIFGQNHSTTTSDPVREAPSMVFRVGVNTGSGISPGSCIDGSMTVYSLRPDKSGNLSAQKVGTIDLPKQ